MPLERPRPADIAACRAVLRAGSKSFATAAVLLPARVRDSATALYAFCRVADDAVDLGPRATRSTIDALGSRIDRIYAGRPDDDPIDRSLSSVVASHDVPRHLFDALLEGMTWDALGRRYETLSDLIAYAARVAGTVGAMMAVVMGRRTPGLVARACDLGVAMQLTNVARDVGEDARRGRLYLPLQWMREAGIAPEPWLEKPSQSEALAALVERLLGEAEGLYRRAELGIGHLPVDCRLAIGAARFIYADIGRSIRRARYDAVHRRAVVGTPRKLWLLARAFATRWRRHAAVDPPPLEPVRFLVAACAERP
ncbi:MAG: phytoene/squalene synthase family protein [Polyangiaceae bacterium]|jgi:phytoene synthase